MEQAGIRISTDMFFESVPDEFVDIKLDKWHFDEHTQTIPIIIPRNYLNLYNFGFAQSRNLPKLSEGVMGLIQMDIVMRGNGRVEQYKGNIVGFSNRLNTILVPQSFMKWANENFAPNAEAQPARLIIEVSNPADSAIASYFFRRKDMKRKMVRLDAGKTTYFLRLIVGIVLGVGLFISILSFYILMLSIFLLLQKRIQPKFGKSITNRIQFQQGSIALSVAHGRIERYCACIIHRISLLVAQLLHRQYPHPISTAGNRIIMGSNQYGYSIIYRCIGD